MAGKRSLEDTTPTIASNASSTLEERKLAFGVWLSESHSRPRIIGRTISSQKAPCINGSFTITFAVHAGYAQSSHAEITETHQKMFSYCEGGILKRYPDLLKTSSFLSGFENKGRHRSLMERVPTLLILHPQPGLLGASYCARNLYQQTTH